jgi:hypothetical protein
MDRPALMAIVVAFLVVLLVLMYLGWRARRKRQRDVATPAAVPVDRGAAIGEFAGKYVATTESGKPLERIAVHGLGFRGTVSLAVTEKGIAARIAGGDEFWIPANDLRGLSRATWTIDRVVEPDGLQVVEWALGDRTVDTYLRFDEPQAFETAVGRLTAERNTP